LLLSWSLSDHPYKEWSRHTREANPNKVKIANMISAELRPIPLASFMCLALILIYAQVMMKTGYPFGGESPRLFLPPPRLSGFQFCQAAVTQLPLCILSYPDNGVVNRRMSGSQPEIDFGSAQSRKGA